MATKDKSILDKFTETMKGLADSASQALKSEEPARVDETAAAYLPFSAEGLVSDPLLVPPIAAQSAPRKKRAVKKRAQRGTARAPEKSTARKARKSPRKAAKPSTRASARARARTATSKSARETSRKTAKRGGRKTARKGGR